MANTSLIKILREVCYVSSARVEHTMMVVMMSLVVSDFFFFFWKKSAVITEETTFTHMVKRKLFRTPLIKLHGFVIKPWQSCLRTCFSCIQALWLLKYSMVRFMVACVELHPILWATASELL